MSALETSASGAYLYFSGLLGFFLFTILVYAVVRRKAVIEKLDVRFLIYMSVAGLLAFLLGTLSYVPNAGWLIFLSNIVANVYYYYVIVWLQIIENYDENPETSKKTRYPKAVMRMPLVFLIGCSSAELIMFLVSNQDISRSNLWYDPNISQNIWLMVGVTLGNLYRISLCMVYINKVQNQSQPQPINDIRYTYKKFVLGVAISFPFMFYTLQIVAIYSFYFGWTRLGVVCDYLNDRFFIEMIFWSMLILLYLDRFLLAGCIRLYNKRCKHYFDKLLMLYKRVNEYHPELYRFEITEEGKDDKHGTTEPEKLKWVLGELDYTNTLFLGTSAYLLSDDRGVALEDLQFSIVPNSSKKLVGIWHLFLSKQGTEFTKQAADLFFPQHLIPIYESGRLLKRAKGYSKLAKRVLRDKASINNISMRDILPGLFIIKGQA